MKKEGKTKDQYIEPKRYGAKGFSYLTLEKRKKLQSMLEKNLPQKEIATSLNMSRSTIYYERMRMGSLNIPYDAKLAHDNAVNGTLINSRQRVEIPRSYQQNISKIYRLLTPLLEEESEKSKIEIINHCIVLLEKMGANPEKMKKPVTGQDVERIISLHKEGKNLGEIERLMNRPRSTIHRILNKFKDNLNKPIGEITYEHVRNKWLSEVND